MNECVLSLLDEPKKTPGKFFFQLYIYFQKAAYTFANSTVQKTSKMSRIIDSLPQSCPGITKLIFSTKKKLSSLLL